MSRRPIHLRTRQRITEATRLIAEGNTLKEVAEALGVSCSTVWSWKNSHPALWQRDWKAAIERVEAEASAKPLVTSDEAEPIQPIDKPLILDAFLEGVYLPYHLGMRESTARQLQTAVNVFQRWTKRPVRIEELSDELVIRFLADFSRQVSSTTVNSKRRALLALWRFAHKKNLIDRLPCDIPKFPESWRDPEAWTVSEVERILTEAQHQPGTFDGISAGDWWLSFLLCLYDSGARVGAVLQVRPDEVNLTEGGFLLRAEVQKTRRARWCAISDQTVKACAAIWSPGRRRMWPWAHTPCWLSRKFKKILEAAGVSFGVHHGGVFHKLRRTSGTLVEQAGGDGSRHLGNTRAVFENHYLDPRMTRRQSLDRLPRPNVSAISVCDSCHKKG